MSSPLMLTKLPRRVSCGACDPKMFAPLPKASGDIFEKRPLKGVDGLPNSCVGCETLPRPDAGAGVPVKMVCVFFDGVSGMGPAAKVASGASMLRLRLEIRPVDMNACGNGLAILKVSGVSQVFSVGLMAPMGNDFPKSTVGLGG